MKVLVTGAKGMLGQDLCPIFEDAGMFVIETDVENLDITDFKAAENFITNARPQIIVHLAAYTNVDGAETDREKADLINHKAAENLARISKKTGAILIYVSTDYVFDGTKTEPYLPNDPVNPLSVYGKTKALGETAVIENAEKYYIARTSWLYGINGKNFIEIMLKLGKAGKEIKVVNDQTGSPTYTVDLALGILKLLNKPFGIYHISGEGETTWYDFANEIFTQADIKADLAPVSTEEYTKGQNKVVAIRPKYSTLQNSVPMRHWKEALQSYLEYRKSLQAE
ncbi:MAG: dTDP-4-dehydrorhamnose reductase [Candidatus Gastranaerophilales bacterium]|nr:dTDP-4-dehydrorhamnose reductase [Candidatus Gastranaerophilales bacterium]